MRLDNRLPRVLHALLHLNGMKRPATSELIADMLRTNSSVVRRTMGGLRDAGIVTSVKGHNGGWSLAKPLSEISLLDIYNALGSPNLFAIGSDSAESTCMLARAANTATLDALAFAHNQFEERLRSISVADLCSEWEAASVHCGAGQQSS